MRRLPKPAIVLLITLAAAGTLGLLAYLRAGARPASTPGGFLSTRSAQLTDARTGNAYSFDLVAREDAEAAGVGLSTLLVVGPSLSLCSASGPEPEIDFSLDGEEFPGNAPLPEIRCGTASGMAVVIDGCTATIDLHGYVHSDYPLVTYMGMMSLDLSLHKEAGPADAQVEITVHTPKEDIRLRGNLDGQVDMDTCQ